MSEFHDRGTWGNTPAEHLGVGALLAPSLFQRGRVEGTLCRLQRRALDFHRASSTLSAPKAQGPRSTRRPGRPWTLGLIDTIGNGRRAFITVDPCAACQHLKCESDERTRPRPCSCAHETGRGVAGEASGENGLATLAACESRRRVRSMRGVGGRELAMNRRLPSAERRVRFGPVRRHRGPTAVHRGTATVGGLVGASADGRRVRAPNGIHIEGSRQCRKRDADAVPPRVAVACARGCMSSKRCSESMIARHRILSDMRPEPADATVLPCGIGAPASIRAACRRLDIDRLRAPARHRWRHRGRRLALR